MVWPGCGRSAIRSSANARSVAIKASTLMAAAMSAVRTSTSRSASASTSMPSMPSVPLINANPSLARNVTGAIPAAAIASRAVAFTDQRQGDVRKRSEVAAGTERAVLVDRRRDVGVEQGQDRVDDDLAHTGESHRQGARPKQHHRPHDFWFDQRAHSGGVRADEGALQFFAPLRRDHGGRQRPETGRDAVHGIVAFCQALDDGRTAGDGLCRRRCQPDWGPSTGDGYHVGGTHTVWADEDFACRDFH